MFTSIISRIPSASVRRRSLIGNSFAYSNSSSNITSKSAFLPNGSLVVGNSSPTALASNFLLSNPAIHLGGAYPALVKIGSNELRFYTSSTPDFSIVNSSAYAGAAGSIGVGTDVKFFRDAAGTLAQRDGLNTQAFRIYNTYSSAGANYERAFFRWNTNIFEIGVDAAGTGTQRQLSFVLGTATSNNPLLITQTFNNAAINFTAMRLNVTDTASSSNSKLLDLQVTGASRFNVDKDGTAYSVFFQSTNSVGDEGGQIILSKPETNSTISGSLTFDSYQNRFRIFETSGTNRGGYYDITSLAAGAGTNLLYPGLTNGAVVNTSESTATTTYTDLATVGPSTTVTIGPSQKAIVMLHCQAMTATNGAECYMSFTGAGVAADDSRAIASATRNAGDTPTVGGSLFITGLTTGSQTFTSKYRTTAGTATYAYRNIIVIPI